MNTLSRFQVPLNVEIESASMHPGSCRGRHAPRHSPPTAAPSPYGHFGSANARRDGPPAAPDNGWRARHNNQWKTSHPGCHQPTPHAQDQSRAEETKKQEEYTAAPATSVAPASPTEKAPAKTTTPIEDPVVQAPESEPEEMPIPPVETASECPRLHTPVLESTQTPEETQTPTSPIATAAASTETLSVEVEKPTPVLGVTFMDDVSIPDKTPLPPAAEFTKVWKLENTGNVVIPAGTPVIFVGGEKFSHKEGSVRIEEDVPVGAKFMVSLAGLRAPKVSGETYTGYWRLCDGEGQLFGDKLWTE